MSRTAWNIQDIERLVLKWRPRLGLLHWEFRVRVDDGDFEDGYMEIERHSDHHRAVIDIKPWIVGEADIPEWVVDDLHDAGFIERGVVHELAHCLFRDVRMHAAEALEPRLSPDVLETLRLGLNRDEERAVDDLATALVDHWPQEGTTNG